VSDVKGSHHRRGRPLEHDRVELLRAARTVAADRGFDALRFSDVSQATGVPVSSLQYAFGTRESLVREVLRTGVSDEVDRLQHAMDRESDPWSRVERFVRLGVSIDDRRRRDGWLLWMQYWRAALRDDELREESAATTRRWRWLLRQAVDDGVDSGQFSIDGTADETAASLVALVDGMSLQVLVGDSHLRSSRAVRAALRSARRILGMDAA
jgi:AcrR family transcriptional regulator